MGVTYSSDNLSIPMELLDDIVSRDPKKYGVLELYNFETTPDYLRMKLNSEINMIQFEYDGDDYDIGVPFWAADEFVRNYTPWDYTPA